MTLAEDYADPSTYDVYPRQWRVINYRLHRNVVAAMLPYPDVTDTRPCQGDEAFTADLSSESGMTKRQIAYMKMKCNGCPVKPACREYGIAHEDYGIWGGTTPTERRSIRRERRQILVEPHTSYEYGFTDEYLAQAVWDATG